VEGDSGVGDGARAVFAEPRQRWRLAFRRPAGNDAESRRDLVPDWLDRLAAAGLPLASRGGGRVRTALALGSPLPVGMAAERELADLVLADRLPAWRVREAVAGALPDGCDLVEIEDVWLGAPPLAGSIAGADYRVTLVAGADPGADVVRGAAESLLAEESVLRVRQKSGRDVAYDLRPLVAGIEVLAGQPTVVRIRARFDPERGSGRPEEVLAALGDRLGQPIVAAETVRERLLLAEDLGDSAADGSSR
jgi:radical SAM-linked protein